MKTILVVHRDRAVRDRFRAALADAHHGSVAVDTADGAIAALRNHAYTVDFAVVEVSLATDVLAFLDQLRRPDGSRVPLAVFSGSVGDAADIASLETMGVLVYVNEHASTSQILPALAPHLFPDNFNRRSSPRVTVGVPVSFRTSQTIAGAITLDIGKGGMSVRTMNPPPSGDGITLKFRLPGAPADLEATGRIAWSDRKVGMGVQFELVKSADQATIDGFVDAQVAQSPPGR